MVDSIWSLCLQPKNWLVPHLEEKFFLKAAEKKMAVVYHISSIARVVPSISSCHPLKARTRKSCLQQPDLLWLKSQMILLVRYSSFSCLSLSLCQPVSQPQNVYTTLTASFHKSIQDDKCKDNWIYGFIRLIGNIEYIFCFSKTFSREVTRALVSANNLALNANSFY